MLGRIVVEEEAVFLKAGEEKKKLAWKKNKHIIVFEEIAYNELNSQQFIDIKKMLGAE